MDPLMLDMIQFAESKSQKSKGTQSLVPVSTSLEVNGGGTVSFEELLSSSMKQVNSLQLESEELVRKLATGDVEDISEVVLASSRAEVALKMFMELRNKFVDAYQQLSRMSA